MANSRQIRGFSLIELLISVIIIGLLTSVSTLIYIKHLKRTRDTKRREDLQSIQAIVENYHFVNQRYPKTTDDPGTSSFWSDCSYLSGNSEMTIPLGETFGKGKYYIPYVVAEGFTANLPVDPRYLPAAGTVEQCYTYKSDGKGYKALAHNTVEQWPQTPASDLMRDPLRTDEPTFAVWSSDSYKNSADY